MTEVADPFSEIPSTMTIPVSPPVKYDGREYAEIVLREPKAGERRQAAEQLRNGTTMSNLLNHDIHLVAKVSGVPVPAVEQMGASRITLAMAYLNRFLASGQETGAN